MGLIMRTESTSEPGDISLDAEESATWDRHDEVGDRFRRRVRSRAATLARDHGGTCHVYASDGITLDAVSP